MSEEKLDNQDDMKGGSRRSRKDEQGRDYICGCGKKYLSYPALYTHIKTKHEGNQPEGTQKTGLAPLKSRIKQKLDEKLLKQIQNWVSLDHLKILDLLDQNALGQVSPSSRIKRDLIGKQIWAAYNELVKNPTLHLDQSSPLDQVLVVYLLAIGQYTSEALFVYYCQFARLFRQAFADGIYEVLNNVLKDFTSAQRSILAQQCRMAPLLCDYFLRFYLGLQQRQQETLIILKILTSDFCLWMYEKGLTPVEINTNFNYQLPRKDLIQPKTKERKADNKADKEEEKDDSQEHQQSSPSDSYKKNSEIDPNMRSQAEMIHEESDAKVQDGSMIAEI